MTQSGAKKPGRIRKWASGLAREQLDHVWSLPQRTFWNETVAGVRRAMDARVTPSRVESFEEAVRRLGLKQRDLDEQLRKHKFVHLVLYAFAAALVVYGTHLALTGTPLPGLGAYIAAAGAAVNGYLHGFRAWQIEHRNLIRLQDAVRIPGTYLVL